MSQKSPGRNDPCPCGSGKKYKKCCLELDAAARRSVVAATPDLPTPESIPDELPSLTDHLGSLAPYTLYRWLDSPECLEKVPPKDRATFKSRWHLSKVRALPTEKIEAQLLAYGLPYSRDKFLASLPPLLSAWDASDPWLANQPDIDPEIACFAGLAACELWRRLAPERPSVEMIDDWIAEAHASTVELEFDIAQAIQKWLKAWDALRPYFTPAMKNLEDANDRLFAGRCQPLREWIIDFGEYVIGFALEDPAQALESLRLFDELFVAFPEEARDYELRRLAATLQMRCGRTAEGERGLLALIAEAPEKAAAYACLADELGEESSEGVVPNLHRAIALLEQAIAYPVVDAFDWDLESRLEDFRFLLESGAQGDSPGRSTRPPE